MLARMMNDWEPLMQLQNQMNRAFESFFDDPPARRGLAAGYPSINLWQDGDDAYAEAELPGLSIEDIEVWVTGKELTISGERKNPADLPNASYHRRERGLGRFSRTMMLPWEIDAGKVEAKLVNGVLTVKLPKCEACKPKKVKLLSA